MYAPRLTELGQKIKYQSERVASIVAGTGGDSYEPFSASHSAGLATGRVIDAADLTERFRVQEVRISDLELAASEFEVESREADKAFHDHLGSQGRKAVEQEEAIDELRKQIGEHSRLLEEQVTIIKQLVADQGILEARLRRQRLVGFLSMTANTTTLQHREGGGERFHWFVKNMSKIWREQAEVYSPAFTSCLFHYTFRLKLRANGPGTPNQGCISCGLNLREGPEDNDAIWPFNLSFELRCIDLMGNTVESAQIHAGQETEDTILTAFLRPSEGADHVLSRGWGNFLAWNEASTSTFLIDDTLHLELAFSK